MVMYCMSKVLGTEQTVTATPAEPEYSSTGRASNPVEQKEKRKKKRKEERGVFIPTVFPPFFFLFSFFPSLSFPFLPFPSLSFPFLPFLSLLLQLVSFSCAATQQTTTTFSKEKRVEKNKTRAKKKVREANCLLLEVCEV